MKKLLLVLTLLVAAGALVWFFALGGRDRLAGLNPTPRIASAFEASSTVMLVGAEGLDGLARETEKLLALLPPDARGEVPPELSDPKLRTETLGFDPMTAEGWRSIGVDPQTGVGLALDTRFVPAGGEPTPLIALAITDRDKLMPALRKLGAKVAIETDPDLGEVLIADEKRFALGKRGDITMLAMATDAAPDSRKTLRASFDQLLKGESLAKDALFKQAFSDLGGAPRYLFYASSAAGLSMFAQKAQLDARKTAIAKFYTDRFPGLGFTLGPKSGGLRLLATSGALPGLRQVLVPQRRAPDFSKHVPRRGVMAMRFSLNLAQLFDGIVTFVPPELESAKGQILIAKNMLPLAIGASWEDLSAGFSGHFAIVTSMPDPSGEMPRDALVMAGVGDAEKADKVLNALLNRLTSSAEGAKKEAVEVRGHKGFRVSMPGLDATIVRAGDVLLGAMDTARIEAALDVGESLSGTAAGDMIDGDAVLGFAAELEAITRSLQSGGADSKAATEMWAHYAKDGFLIGSAVVDEDGLLFGGGEGGGAMVAFMAGVGAAVAVPAFVKYVKKSKTSEAIANVNRMYTSAASHYAEKQAFPPSVGLTPERDFCAGGADQFAADPGAWQAPTWQALLFAMDEPHRYKYELVTSATGFTARAVGDLDCDGTFSTFERIGTVGVDGAVTGDPIRKEMETE